MIAQPIHHTARSRLFRHLRPLRTRHSWRATIRLLRCASGGVATRDGKQCTLPSIANHQIGDSRSGDGPGSVPARLVAPLLLHRLNRLRLTNPRLSRLLPRKDRRQFGNGWPATQGTVGSHAWRRRNRPRRRTGPSTPATRQTIIPLPRTRMERERARRRLQVPPRK